MRKCQSPVRHPRWGLGLLAALSLALVAAGCVPGVADQGNVPAQGLAASTCPSPPVLCVSPSGSDANPGTDAAPFRTITHALSVAAGGQTIQVLPGPLFAYTAAGGEVFPLVVPTNVSLIGDEPNKGAGASSVTAIQGTGPVPGVTDAVVAQPAEAMIVAGAASVIAGFDLIAATPTAGNAGTIILIEGPVAAVTIRNNRIIGAQRNGVLEQALGGNTFLGNIFSQNGFAAYTSNCNTAATPTGCPGTEPFDTFQGNTFARGGTYGAYLLNGTGGGGFDFGGGGVSTGGNNFCMNSIGIYLNVGGILQADNNAWNFGAPSPTLSFSATPVSNFDIWDVGNTSNVLFTTSLAPTATCP